MSMNYSPICADRSQKTSTLMKAAAAHLAPALLLAVVGGVTHAAQTPKFSSKTEAVLVDVLVSDRGRPVLGLGASDFEVLERGDNRSSSSRPNSSR